MSRCRERLDVVPDQLDALPLQPELLGGLLLWLLLVLSLLLLLSSSSPLLLLLLLLVVVVVGDGSIGDPRFCCK